MSDVTLPPGRYRDYDNSATVILHRAPSPRVERPSFRELLTRHYAAIRRAGAGVRHAGALIAAVDTGGFAALSLLSVVARPDGPSAAIIGRHTHAHLFLDPDPTVSLRHMAVIIGASPQGEAPALRIIDLRTPLGFEDEHGNRCRSLVVDGPLMLRCGQHALFLLTTGADVSWPEHADDAWAQLPRREYLGTNDEPDDEHYADWPSSSSVAETLIGGRRFDADSTMVLRVAGPVVARRHLLVPDEDPRGTLVVTTPDGTRELVLGDRALRRGVLLGRYHRCEEAGGARILDENVSRVHLMIISIGDVPYAIDTASRNGTFVRGQGRPVLIAPLEAGRELALAHGRTRVQWRPA